MRLAVPARLQTTFGDQNSLMIDLSLTGARLALSEDVAVGRDVILTWGCGEGFGRVVWFANGECGIKFDRMIDPQLVIATRDLHDGRLGDRERSHLRRLAKEWVEGRI